MTDIMNHPVCGIYKEVGQRLLLSDDLDSVVRDISSWRHLCIKTFFTCLYFVTRVLVQFYLHSSC